MPHSVLSVWTGVCRPLFLELLHGWLGADGGSRTRTGSPPQDFKSCVSTSSTTSAVRRAVGNAIFASKCVLLPLADFGGNVGNSTLLDHRVAQAMAAKQIKAQT
jgi:hypothetical protein